MDSAMRILFPLLTLGSIDCSVSNFRTVG
jgi:hypothetical protein